MVKGFKDGTKTHYLTGNSPGTKGAAKIKSVMSEWRKGTLHSGAKDGPKVKNRKQAVAIALSEARRNPMKKAEGGAVHSDAAQDKKTVAAGVHKHERNMHPGKPLTKLAHGGRAMVRDRGPLIKPRG